MDEIIIEKLNNTYFKINCNIEQALNLKSYFECHAENYWFHPKYKAKMWNGKISYFNMYDCTLPIGLIFYLRDFLKKYKYKYILAFDKNKFFNNINRKDLHNLYKVIFKDSDYYPRDYQDEAIYKFLKRKRGVIESPTASGKSLIIYSLIRFIMGVTKGKILLVVPNISLTNQMFSDFKEYGWERASNEISILYSQSKKYDKSKRILISTWQSIYNKRQLFFSEYNAVIVDETHHASSNSIQNILKKSINAEYKFGLTGTLPTLPIDIFNIYGYIGPKLLQIETKELQEMGYLANIKIANLLLKYPKEDVELNKNAKFLDEYDFIIKNKNRNKVFKYIINNINTNDNILILCQRIKHLDEVYNYITELYGSDKIIYKIDGDVHPDIREQIRKDIEKQDKVILIATYGTTSIGINIKKLHHVVFASPYKAKIKVLQSIGRGLRIHKSKKKLILWDLVDDLRWWTNKRNLKDNNAFRHFKIRLKYYREKKFDYVNKIVDLLNL